MEDKDDVQGCELGAADCEGEPDEDAVEDDAKFEDEDCGHLGGITLRNEAALELIWRDVLVGDMRAGVPEVIFATSVAMGTALLAVVQLALLRV